MMIFAGSVGNPFLKNRQSASVTGDGEGVYTLEFNGKELKKKFVIKADNATTLTFSKDQNTVYIANEVRNFTGLNGSGGGITSYRVLDNGNLEKLNDSISYGSRPAYVSLSESGRYLLVANHGSHSSVTCHYEQAGNGEWKLKREFDDSSVAVFEVEEDGRIGKLTDLVKMEGNGYWCHGGGQSTSHVHSVRMHHGYVYSCNRGADEIEVMKLNENTGKLSLITKYHTRNAYAPRYLDFHPTLNLMYVLYENYPAISVFECKDGNLTEKQFIETKDYDYYLKYPLPEYQNTEASIDEVNTCGMADHHRSMPSDIHITEDGKFLYVSNRCFGEDGTITSFKVKDDGTLEFMEELHLNGCDPRGFMISSDRNNLFVGLLDKDIVEVYHIENNGVIHKITEAEVNGVSRQYEMTSQ